MLSPNLDKEIVTEQEEPTSIVLSLLGDKLIS